MLSLEAIDLALVELSDLFQRSGRFSTKGLEVDTVPSLENGWSALARILQS